MECERKHPNVSDSLIQVRPSKEVVMLRNAVVVFSMILALAGSAPPGSAFARPGPDRSGLLEGGDLRGMTSPAPSIRNVGSDAASTTPVPIGHLQPRQQQFSPSTAEQDLQQKMSIFNAEQQRLDEQLDRRLNICRGC
jgi:hypothetical protein